jgi:hypothetical protein
MTSVRAAWLAVLLLAQLFGASAAFACSCLPRSVEQLLEEPVVVFTGTARSAEPAGEGMAVRTRFAVETMWKGPAADSVDVEAGTEVAAGCGIIFEVGRRYTIAAYEDPETGAYSTNSCTMLPLLNTDDQAHIDAALQAYKDAHAGAADAQDFEGATLSDFDFRGRDLAGASFTGALLVNGTMARARLAGAKFFGTSFNNVDLSGANLRDADFAGAILTGVTLSGATLDGASLVAATLASADLRDLDFAGVVLVVTNLSGADLSGANLGAAILVSADLSGARYDSHTIWPEGFDPVAAGAIRVGP